MRSALPVVAVALALAAGACRSSGSDEPPPSSTTTTTAASPTVAAPAASSTTVAATPAEPSTTTTTAPPAPLQGLGLETLATDLTRPTFVTTAPGDQRLYVVEAAGVVSIFDGPGVRAEEPFLEIRDVVNDSGVEQGLLGLAFHPDFVNNGRVFAYYTGPGNDSRLVELAAAGDRADPASEQVLLEFAQPTDRHNGGMLAFGPDGFLYLSLGEGGAASVNAQDPSTLLGSILRLDVDGGDPYGVPADNPFVDGGGAPEVWAYGLRNPWRFGIDPADRLIYIADVGHSDWEEIDVISLDDGGANFGWLPMEGNHCFLSGCNPDDFTLPVVEYNHSEGCSVTGGFVYRGSAIPELDGHYFYADWCRGWVRSFHYAGGTVTDPHDWSEDLAAIGQVNSFGLDAAGELLAVTWDGSLHRIVPRR